MSSVPAPKKGIKMHPGQPRRYDWLFKKYYSKPAENVPCVSQSSTAAPQDSCINEMLQFEGINEKANASVKLKHEEVKFDSYVPHNEVVTPFDDVHNSKVLLNYDKAACVSQTSPPQRLLEYDFDASSEHKTSFSLEKCTSNYISEDYRNFVYDSWLSDCKKWNTKRLALFYEVAGENSHKDESMSRASILRTYASEISSKHRKKKKHHRDKLSTNTSIEESSVVLSTREREHFSEYSNDFDPNAAKFDVWEEWYRIERLNLHRSLNQHGILNWYEELLFEEENRFMEGTSMCNSLLEAEALHDNLCRMYRPEVPLGAVFST